MQGHHLFVGPESPMLHTKLNVTSRLVLEKTFNGVITIYEQDIYLANVTKTV